MNPVEDAWTDAARQMLGASERREPATEAGRRVAAWLAMASYLTLPTAEWPDVNEAIRAIEAEARRSTVISPECYPQAHRYRAVPGTPDLVRCYRCGKERYA